ncbi:MAG: substrate-binding domain-containing protein [Flavobacteriaceae bacterium]|tara:strand:- start:47 stop:901 length:855 start_codon:yes stop_codon:yes gene_type:complete
MKTVRIGGVPEHFNYAWYIGLKKNAFKAQGIDLRWVDCPGGTGQMTEALKQNSIDMAIVLTEGIIKAISDGISSKIVQTFVKSPLIWGVHVDTGSNYTKASELKNTQAAISRMGSGSHLMAYLQAQKLGWNTTRELHFKIIKNLEGGVKALRESEADYFLWEKYTTKPLVDSGVFRRIGECPTPWPCFVIAATDSFIENETFKLKSILETINPITKEFKNIADIDTILSKRYGQKREDVQAWLAQTEWSQKNIQKETLENVQNKLLELKLISQKLDINQLRALL